MSRKSEIKNSLTVIIPTFNNIKGIEYLENYFKNKEYQIIVIDNGLDPRLRGDDTGNLVYLPQEKNLGFAGGVNKGARDVKTKWMLILNDDIEFKVKSEEIEKLIEFAEKKKLDAVSPILKNQNGEIENYGYRVLPIGKIKLIKENYSLDPRLRGDDNSIDGLTAACLLIKTSIFKKLGGFDESFFAYLEDVDFFIRFKKAGYKMGITDVEVLHNHMTTAKTMGNFKARQDMINWWKLYFKHPEKFKFNLEFVVERLRNFSGFIKASLKSLL